VDEIIRVAPFRLQLERSPKSARVLAIADAGPQIAITAREMTEFEFLDGAERERFAALLSALACPDPNLSTERTLNRSLSSMSMGAGASALTRGASSLSLPPVTAGPDGTTLVTSPGPLSPGAGGTGVSGDASDPMKRAPPGTVRSTFRAPSVADPSPLWAAGWPHDDVKLWVGTYNVSKVSRQRSRARGRRLQQ
jgi:hypothetical protein